jgi:hypothetical protein
MGDGNVENEGEENPAGVSDGYARLLQEFQDEAEAETWDCVERFSREIGTLRAEFPKPDADRMNIFRQISWRARWISITARSRHVPTQECSPGDRAAMIQAIQKEMPSIPLSLAEDLVANDLCVFPHQTQAGPLFLCQQDQRTFRATDGRCPVCGGTNLKQVTGLKLRE